MGRKSGMLLFEVLPYRALHLENLVVILPLLFIPIGMLFLRFLGIFSFIHINEIILKEKKNKNCHAKIVVLNRTY